MNVMFTYAEIFFQNKLNIPFSPLCEARVIFKLKLSIGHFNFHSLVSLQSSCCDFHFAFTPE